MKKPEASLNQKSQRMCKDCGVFLFEWNREIRCWECRAVKRKEIVSAVDVPSIKNPVVEIGASDENTPSK
jgi:hypothetical protein